MRLPHTFFRLIASSAPVRELRQNSRPDWPDSSRAFTVRPSSSLISATGGDVAAGLDDAVVAERDAEAGIGADQAALADADLLLAAAGQRAHQRGAAADVAAGADDDALR